MFGIIELTSLLSLFHMLKILLPALFVLTGMLVATAFPPQTDPPPLELSPSLLAQVCDGHWSDTVVPYASSDSSPDSERFVHG